MFIQKIRHLICRLIREAHQTQILFAIKEYFVHEASISVGILEKKSIRKVLLNAKKYYYILKSFIRGKTALFYCIFKRRPTILLKALGLYFFTKKNTRIKV